MNADVKALWVAALRSGKYPQSKHSLRTAVGYCCLGGLCEVAKAEGVIDSYSGRDISLPAAVRSWAELPSLWGADVQIGDERDALTDWNDSGKRSAEIAYAIEAQL